MKKLTLILGALFLMLSFNVYSQVAINDDGGTPDGSAMLDVQSTSKGLLIPNVALTGTTDASTILTPAVSLLVYNTATVSDVTPGYYYNSGSTGSPVWTRLVSTGLTIGQSYQGGIIFWLDATGQHGLIAATSDQSTGIQWFNGFWTTINAVRDGIGAGMYNTERIIADQGTGSYAAQLCANYQGGGYGDWYLPSKYELNLLYVQKDVVGGFTSGQYWSSSESSSDDVWYQWFSSGTQGNAFKDATYIKVRAVRAF